MIIRGNTVGSTSLPGDYAQTDPTRADYLKNKPDVAIAEARTTADAAKAAAEAALPLSGGTMTGALNVMDPTQAGHAAHKGYVDGKHMTASVTLPASGWSSAAPYTQSVSVAGILAADQPHFGVVYSGNWEAEKEAFALVDDLDTAAGSLTFTCYAQKPEVDLTIQLEVNR